MKRESFIFYRSFMEALSELNDKQYARVFRAITTFALDGVEIDLAGIEKVIFSLVKPQLVANQKKYENGCKGGRKSTEEKAKENQEETEKQPKQNQKESKPKPNDNDNVNVNLNVNLKEEMNKEEKSTSTLKDIDISLQYFLDKHNISLDSYNSTIYEMDFDRLSKAFDESSWLKKNIKSFRKVCEIYPKILSGYYRDYEATDDEIIIPQEEWATVEKVLTDLKYNSANFNSNYEDYDVFKAKQLSIYDRLSEDIKAYYVDYNGFIALYDYKSLENEKARFIRDFEKFCQKRRKKLKVSG